MCMVIYVPPPEIAICYHVILATFEGIATHIRVRDFYYSYRDIHLTEVASYFTITSGIRAAIIS